MLNLNCDHLFLCKLPILFSTVKHKLGLNKSSFPIHPQIQNLDFKILFLGFVYFQVFPNSQKWRIEILEKLRMHYQILPNSLKCLKIGIFEASFSSYVCQTVSIIFQYDMCCKERRSQFMITLLAFKQKCLSYNVGNNFVSVKRQKYCFVTQMRI